MKQYIENLYKELIQEEASNQDQIATYEELKEKNEGTEIWSEMHAYKEYFEGHAEGVAHARRKLEAIIIHVAELEEKLIEKEKVNCRAEWTYTQFEKEAKEQGKVEQEKHFLMMRALHHGIMTGIEEARQISEEVMENVGK